MAKPLHYPLTSSVLPRTTSPPHPSSYGGPPTPPTSNPSSKVLLFTGYNEPSSTTPSPLKSEYNDDELTTDKMDQLIERKRKRRESHNVVERRRRDNINARIDELGTLLPKDQQQNNKLNRGVILQQSVEHIRQLHQRVTDQQQRIQELEALLQDPMARHRQYYQSSPYKS